MRDEFSAAVKDALAKRAAYMCSKEDCLELTIGPHSDPLKATRTGEAAHITAAAKGGARFDAALSSVQRSSIENGIWLCATCATRIDKDEDGFSADIIRQWKRDHEAWVAAGGAVANVPMISVETLDGFSIPKVGSAEVSADESAQGRESRILMQLGGRATITELELVCQLPEGVYRAWLQQQPIGVEVRFEPIVPEVLMLGQVQMIGQPPPPTKWRLAVGNLRPQHYIDLRLRSVLSEPDPSFSLGPSLPGNRYWLHGHFRWEYRGAPKRRDLTIVLSYDRDARRISSSSATTEKVDLRKVFSFP